MGGRGRGRSRAPSLPHLAGGTVRYSPPVLACVRVCVAALSALPPPRQRQLGSDRTAHAPNMDYEPNRMAPNHPGLRSDAPFNSVGRLTAGLVTLHESGAAAGALLCAGWSHCVP